MNSNEEAQRDELLALTSIYDSITTDFDLEDLNNGEPIDTPSGKISMEVDIPTPFHIYTKTDSPEGSVKEQTVEHLPPVELSFKFCPSYPEESPPNFSLSCSWLNQTQLVNLCEKLDELWDENCGSEIMFIWAEYIKSNTLETSDIVSSLTLVDGNLEKCESVKTDPRAIVLPSSERTLYLILGDHNVKKEEELFKHKIFECNVCFMERSGQNSMQFWPCKHVYCKECMRSYFEVQINEGNLNSLKCPQEKCDSDALPLQVQSLVTTELYTKWENCLLNSTLSSFKDIQICPRRHCQYPVTMDQKLGHCPGCDFVFCGICRHSWHGVEPCKLVSSQTLKILEDYQNGDPQRKLELENQFGKKLLDSILNDHLSLKFIKENARSCPRCKANIEKIDGCNKMTCNRCHTNFCWLCNTTLSSTTPYRHFEQATSPCFNKLFQGMLPEDFEVVDWSDEEP